MQWQIRHPMPSILRKHFLDIIVASFINLIVCTLMWWFISNSSPKSIFALILIIVGFEVNEKIARDFQDILISCMQIVTSIENLCNKSLYTSFRQTDSKQTRQLSLSGSIHEKSIKTSPFVFKNCYYHFIYNFYNFSQEAFLVELLHHGFLVLHGSMSPCQLMVEEFLLTERQYSTSSRRKGNKSDSVLISRLSKLLFLVVKFV